MNWFREERFNVDICYSGDVTVNSQGRGFMNLSMRNFYGYLLLYRYLCFCKEKKDRRRDKWPKKQLILGHRGARAHAPENTIKSLTLAMEYGADGVEFDVFLSKDGVPVIIHDASLTRTTNGSGKVFDFTAEELYQLNAAHSQNSFGVLKIPSLSEALENLPTGAVANIEIKESKYNKSIFVEKIIEITKRYENKLTIIISSFDGELLSIYRKHASHQLIAFLASERDIYWPESLKHLPAIDPDALHLPPSLYTSSLLRLAHLKNMPVAIWTVNDTGLAKKLWSQGIDGIFTDNIPKIVKALRG